MFTGLYWLRMNEGEWDSCGLCICIRCDVLALSTDLRQQVYDQGLFSFAHELGHTFGYDLGTFARLPGANSRPYGQCDEQVHACLENFANEFGYIWLSHTPQRHELENFLITRGVDPLVNVYVL